MKRFLIFFLLVFSSGLFAQDVDEKGIVERPSPPKLYNNFSKAFPDFLSANEAAQLEKKLESFANSTSNQVVVVVIDSLYGLEAWDYATRLGHKWAVGQKKFDNGVVILIKPTGGAGQRDLSIMVGYGLEGAIPDATAKRIEEEEIIPALKNNNYNEALNKATDVIFALAKGEYDSKEYDKSKSGSSGGGWKYVGIGIILIFLIMRVLGKGGGSGWTGGSRGWSHGGGFRGFGGFGGGGGFSGGGGGGFGGFGGGGFGGGGASGKW
ncbi:MAG: hypothetical protein FD123_3026 [Bacteroidetes bacterium]|nr:MAG: hypothetical protein FD123_3026 [Bacteroidota bacterium]